MGNKNASIASCEDAKTNAPSRGNVDGRTFPYFPIREARYLGVVSQGDIIICRKLRNMIQGRNEMRERER